RNDFLDRTGIPLCRRRSATRARSASGRQAATVRGTITVMIRSGSGMSRRSFLIRGVKIGGLGLLVACRPSPAAPTSGAPPATIAPIVPNQATAPPVVAAVTPAPAPTPAGAIKRGGSATILQTNDFVSMDPIFASGPTAAVCYDWLLAWRPNADGTYAVQPSLATAWETTAEKIVFHLRD